MTHTQYKHKLRKSDVYIGKKAKEEMVQMLTATEVPNFHGGGAFELEL